MKAQQGQYRQGDVLFTRSTVLPEDKRLRGALKLLAPNAGRYIYARGEATGHHHSSVAEGCTLNLDEGGVMWLTVEELTRVEHQEHEVIVLEPGTYRVDRQQECDPWAGWRQVSD